MFCLSLFAFRTIIRTYPDQKASISKHNLFQDRIQYPLLFVFNSFFLHRKINRSVPILIINCDEKIGALWHRIGNYQTDLFQFGMIDPCGSRDGVVARALLWPGFPDLASQCGSSFQFVFVLAPKGFSPSPPVLLPPHKPNSIFQIDLETVDKKSHQQCNFRLLNSQLFSHLSLLYSFAWHILQNY